MFSILCSIIYCLTFDFIPNTYNFIFKSASIFLFIFFLIFSGQKIKSISFIILALCASAIGDIFLTFLGEKYFLLGILSFSIAHIFYGITFFTYLLKPFLLTSVQKITIAIFVILSISMILFLNLYLPNLLKIPTYLYISLLNMMVLISIMISPFPNLIFWGALSFAVSDSLLSISTFITLFIGNAYGVWFFYYTAQFFIVKGIININRSARLSLIQK